MTAFDFGISPLFTWESIAAAFFGGMLLGCSVVFKTSCLGGVLGLSHYIKQLFWLEKKRYFFIGGMIIASFVLDASWKKVEELPPPGVDNSERAKIFLRMIFGTFVMGLGSAMQFGCTSGHGLTGLARLSYRSWFVVPLFMVVGLMSGTAFQSSHAFPPMAFADDDQEWYEGPLIACGLAVLLLAAALVLTLVGKFGSENFKIAGLLLGEFLAGAVFASGLLISGMAFPSKVASFLDVASGNWDLCLPFVMGGGCCVTFPYFLGVEFLKLQDKTLLLKAPLDLPPRTRMPDATLAQGAVYFGLGWGICGLTPCSLTVNMTGAPSWEIAAAYVSFAVGMLFTDMWAFARSWLANKLGRPQAQHESQPKPAAAAILKPTDAAKMSAQLPTSIEPIGKLQEHQEACLPEFPVASKGEEEDDLSMVKLEEMGVKVLDEEEDDEATAPETPQEQEDAVCMDDDVLDRADTLTI